MSLDPRAVAALGLGCIPAILARIGFFDAETGDEEEVFSHLLGPTCSVVDSPRRRRSRPRRPEPIRASTVLALAVSVQAGAGLRLPASASLAAIPAVSAVAGMRLGAAVSCSATAGVSARADVFDVLLEMLLAE